jgi:hypothetical protein
MVLINKDPMVMNGEESVCQFYKVHRKFPKKDVFYAWSLNNVYLAKGININFFFIIP